VTDSKLDSGLARGSPADRELISRAQAGDISAFDEIVARYKNRIYNFVYRMCGRREAAEDIAQEVFVRAFLEAKSIRADGSLAAWLYRVAANLVIDEHRKRQTEKKVVSRSLDQPPNMGSAA
jgi:RNA polymerase sigma-70 factor (ECF subfamily)